MLLLGGTAGRLLKIVTGFFAGVLRAMGLPANALGWSLLGFNAGVEIGQAVIVLAAAPVLAFLRARRSRAAAGVVNYGSLLAIAAGGYWLVQRTPFP